MPYDAGGGAPCSFQRAIGLIDRRHLPYTTECGQPRKKLTCRESLNRRVTSSTPCPMRDAARVVRDPAAQSPTLRA
jgi:hypothetical protein